MVGMPTCQDIALETSFFCIVISLLDPETDVADVLVNKSNSESLLYS